MNAKAVKIASFIVHKKSPHFGSGACLDAIKYDIYLMQL